MAIICGMRRRSRSVRNGRSRGEWEFLSPVDREWAWQDSAYITRLRETVLELCAMSQGFSSRRPVWEERVKDPEDLTVLRVLDEVSGIGNQMEHLKTELVLELRARRVSWELISVALRVRGRRRAHEKYGGITLYDNGRSWEGRLEYELDAARRVAVEQLSSDDLGDDERDKVMEFLEWSNAATTSTKSLQRRYR